MLWTLINKGDVRGRILADLHYTRQTPGHPMWTRPGYNLVLYYADRQGAALWCWWRPKWEAGQERKDRLRVVECTMFRNERSGAASSRLIAEAVAVLDLPGFASELHLDAPVLLPLLTGVSSRATAKRRSRRALPGECFRRAGWLPTALRGPSARADVWLEAPTRVDVQATEAPP